MVAGRDAGRRGRTATLVLGLPAPHLPFCLPKEGADVSVTSTMNSHVAVLPDLSFAVTVTVTVPTGMG